uniref:Peptidase S1 domain-containing protein n=1 Tax=Malurus cyaneus samueli TaxID=2593467 RepID=A0A8C5TCY7_9PASS
MLLLKSPLLTLCWGFCRSSAGWDRGGPRAQPHSHPYMAFLKVAELGHCGGFLVAPDWVMSAAHCMGNTTVILGAHDVHKPEKTQQVRGVLKYYEHPEYDPETMYNDIMLLQLTSKVTLNEYVKTIPLPKSGSDLPTGTKCLIAGWGLIDEDRATNNGVGCGTEQTRDKHFPKPLPKPISRSKIHLLSPQGDSGGPLVCNKVAQGIVSFGYDSPPGVYTRISNYLPWIRKIMKE